MHAHTHPKQTYKKTNVHQRTQKKHFKKTYTKNFTPTLTLTLALTPRPLEESYCQEAGQGLRQAAEAVRLAHQNGRWGRGEIPRGPDCGGREPQALNFKLSYQKFIKLRDVAKLGVCFFPSTHNLQCDFKELLQYFKNRLNMHFLNFTKISLGENQVMSKILNTCNTFPTFFFHSATGCVY